MGNEIPVHCNSSKISFPSLGENLDETFGSILTGQNVDVC